MRIKEPQAGWNLRLEPDEGKLLRICWAGDGINQYWDVEWIEITEDEIQSLSERRRKMSKKTTCDVCGDEVLIENTEHCNECGRTYCLDCESGSVGLCEICEEESYE